MTRTPRTEQFIPPRKSRIHVAPFGRTTDGASIDSFLLTNQSGVSVRLMNYGASLIELNVPDRSGNVTDIVLGFDSFSRYLGAHPYFGGTIGRYANRIANGRFELDGIVHQLAINDPPNSLHGGARGFDRRVWRGELLDGAQEAGVRFVYTSQEGEENFSGNVTVIVTYTLSDGNELHIQYAAETDKATPLNLTHHSYFNLAGGGDVLGHVLQINADRYTPVDNDLVPTGEIASVEGTPFDFRKPLRIGARLAELGAIGGYDHNFVLNGEIGTVRLAARVNEPASGRQLEIWTNEPGLQLYSGTQLDGTITGKRSTPYRKYAGLCLEPQHYPDSPNRPNFPSTILRPGSRFRSETTYKFTVH